MDIKKIGAGKIVTAICVLICLLGAGLRFYRITENQFVYYDEGMYLNHSRNFLNLVERNPPQGFGEFMNFLKVSLKISLNSNKPLWFFLSGLRGCFGGVDALYFTRLLSAIFGSLTILLIYLFAKRYYDSFWAGLLSAGILAVFPSHLYYSRLGLQEALSAFCFLSGMYLYLFSRKLHVKTFISGFFFACVFFTNYRMIIIPLLVAFSEVFVSLSQGNKIQFRKYLWNTLTFFAVIFLVGNLYGAKNTIITFAWMFHQADLAKGHFDISSLFSYPYYIFCLESIFFGVLFFGNIYFARQGKWMRSFPFFLACLQMLFFSFPQEKGARYICVVMPFMAMAAAALTVSLFQEKKPAVFRKGLIVIVGLMFCGFLFKANTIVHFNSDYGCAIQQVSEVDGQAKFFSTQNQVQSLYAPVGRNVIAAPRNLKSLLAFYLKGGYRYLVIGPQAYISYTSDGKRFSPKLIGYLDFIVRNIPPIKEYPHFNKRLMERFVLEHNENLNRSLSFLRSNTNGELGFLRVYDVRDIIIFMRRTVGAQNDKAKDLEKNNTFF